MHSSTRAEYEETFEWLRNTLKEYDDQYGEFLDNNLDTSEYHEESPKLKDIAELLEISGRHYSRMYGAIEEAIVKYEAMMEVFDTELIDGRTVWDAFEEISVVTDGVDSIMQAHEQAITDMLRSKDLAEGIMNNLSEKDSTNLMKAFVAKDLKDGVDKLVASNGLAP